MPRRRAKGNPTPHERSQAFLLRRGEILEASLRRAQEALTRALCVAVVLLERSGGQAEIPVTELEEVRLGRRSLRIVPAGGLPGVALVTVAEVPREREGGDGDGEEVPTPRAAGQQAGPQHASQGRDEDAQGRDEAAQGHDALRPSG